VYGLRPASEAHALHDRVLSATPIDAGIGNDLLRTLLLASCLVTLGPASACTINTYRPIRLASDTELPDRSVVLFFVDGLARDRMHALIADGRLPAIESNFIKHGVAVEHAVASLPSVTYANTVSMLTGVLPHRHGIVGNTWFDRRTLIRRDYRSASTFLNVNEDFTCPTLFELLGERFTVNLRCHTRRGATVTLEDRLLSGIDYFIANYHRVDERVGAKFFEIPAVADRRRQWPSFILVYFPGVDDTGHAYGVDSWQYDQALQSVDTQIGNILRAMREARLDERTWFFLVSDHGHVPRRPGRTFDVASWLTAQRGLRLHDGPVGGRTFCARFRPLDDADAVLIVGADRRVVLHLRHGADWQTRPEPGQIHALIHGRPSQTNINDGNALTDQPGVELVCYPLGPDRIVLEGRTWRCAVERRTRDGRLQYRLDALNTSDASDWMPPPYAADPAVAAFVRAGWHDGRDWLDATCATDYPDLVPQVVEMFDTPRGGDLVVFASDGWALAGREPSGHGSCIAADMRVPFHVLGPDLPAGGRVRCARLVDMVPTVLDLIGETGAKTQASFDGASIAPLLRSAAPDELSGMQPVGPSASPGG